MLSASTGGRRHGRLGVARRVRRPRDARELSRVGVGGVWRAVRVRTVSRQSGFASLPGRRALALDRDDERGRRHRARRGGPSTCGERRVGGLLGVARSRQCPSRPRVSHATPGTGHRDPRHRRTRHGPLHQRPPLPETGDRPLLRYHVVPRTASVLVGGVRWLALCRLRAAECWGTARRFRSRSGNQLDLGRDAPLARPIAIRPQVHPGNRAVRVG